MLMGKGSAPKPPNPMKTAAAQEKMNVNTALTDAAINRVDQYGPDGSIVYRQSGTTSVGGRDIPTYSMTTTLSPQQQAIKDQEDAAQLNLGTLAKNQSAFLNEYMGKPVDLSTGNIENYMNTHFMDDFSKDWDESKSRLETDLANKGLRLGSDAYSRAMADYSKNRSNARDNLYGNQYDRAMKAVLTERNQPLNEITALLSGSQITNPVQQGVAGVNVAGTDLAGLTQAGYENELAAYNAKQQGISKALGGLFGIAGAFAGNPGLM
jgi:hypothetical protein